MSPVGRLFSLPLLTIDKYVTCPKGWGTELARQAYLEAAEAGTPVVTAESGASWCSIQAEHARGSVLYTIRAVGESGTEEQVRTSLDRVLETWLSAPEGEKTSEIC